MSVSRFQRLFKTAVGMGVIPCRTKLRLNEARRLMSEENFNVTQAALEVGYESVSQFIREYKKLFGVPPRRDVAKKSRGGPNTSPRNMDYLTSSLNFSATYSAISQSCSSVPPPMPIPPAIFPL